MFLAEQGGQTRFAVASWSLASCAPAACRPANLLAPPLCTAANRALASCAATLALLPGGSEMLMGYVLMVREAHRRTSTCVSCNCSIGTRYHGAPDTPLPC